MKNYLAASIIAIPFILASCSTLMPSANNTNSAIVQTAEQVKGNWIITTLNGKPIARNNRSANIEFSGNGISGGGFCNRYFGAIIGTYPNISFGPIGATQMACIENNLMALEIEFHNMLGAVKSAEQVENKLRFKNESGVVIAEFAKAPS